MPETAKRTPKADFMKPQQPSPELAAIVGNDPQPRSEITKRVWAYIKQHGLQDKRERRLINSDEKLLPVLGAKQVSMFEIIRAVNRHLTPVSTMPKSSGNKESAIVATEPAGVIDEAAPVAVLFDPDQLEPWPGLNPRKHFDPERVAEITESVRENGILQPVLVHDTGKPVRWIVMGETRWRAAKASGRKVPAIVRVLSEADALKFAMLENIQRNDLLPIEEARGFQRMLELDPNLTQEELGKQLGKSQSYVANRIRLLALPDQILEMINDGRISVGDARDLLVPFAKLAEPYRTKFFAEIVNKHDPDDDFAWLAGNIATDMSRTLSKQHVGWRESAPLFDPKLHKECGCGGPSFAYAGDGGSRYARCFNVEWWDTKQSEADKQLKAAKKADQEKATADAENAAETSKISVQGYSEFMREHGYRHRPIDQEPLDASQLTDARFVVVPARHLLQPSVYCVDDQALSRARKPVNALRKQLLSEKRAERTERDLAEARAAQLEPWMLGEMMRSRPSSDALIAIAREIGVANGVKQSDIYDAVRTLGAEDITLLFKICALRSKKGELFGDPVADQVEATLKRKFGPGVRALVKRLLEGVEIPEDADGDDEFDDEEGDDAECVECGCTDSAACVMGCSWFVIDRERGVGVCSSCAESLEDAQRKLTAVVAA